MAERFGIPANGGDNDRGRLNGGGIYRRMLKGTKLSRICPVLV